MSDGGDAEIEERIDAVVEDAARIQLDRGDFGRLVELPVGKRDLARLRLAVLLLWRRDNALIGSAAEAARLSRQSRSAFYSTLKAFAPDGTIPLGALGLYLEKAEGMPTGGRGEMAQAEGAVIRLLMEDPSLGVAEIARRLEAAGIGPLAKTTLGRIVDRARRDAPATAPFGARLAVDSASLDLVDTAGDRQRLFAVLDLGTALVASWAVLPERDFGFAYGTVLAAARGRPTPDGRGGSAISDGVRVATVAGPGDARVTVSAPDFVDPSLRGRFYSAGWSMVSDPRRTGRALVAAFGGTVGDRPVMAGFAPPNVLHRSRDVSSLGEAGPLALAGIRDGIEEHQRRRLSLAAEGPGRPVDLLRAVFDGVVI